MPITDVITRLVSVVFLGAMLHGCSSVSSLYSSNGNKITFDKFKQLASNNTLYFTQSNGARDVEYFKSNGTTKYKVTNRTVWNGAWYKGNDDKVCFKYLEDHSRDGCTYFHNKNGTMVTVSPSTNTIISTVTIRRGDPEGLDYQPSPKASSPSRSGSGSSTSFAEEHPVLTALGIAAGLYLVSKAMEPSCADIKDRDLYNLCSRNCTAIVNSDVRGLCDRDCNSINDINKWGVCTRKCNVIPDADWKGLCGRNCNDIRNKDLRFVCQLS